MERKAVHVDSIRLLIVNFNAIKMTQLLTEYNRSEFEESLNYSRVQSRPSPFNPLHRDAYLLLQRQLPASGVPSPSEGF